MAYWTRFDYENRDTNSPEGSDFISHNEEQLSKLLQDLHEEFKKYGKEGTKKIVIAWSD